MNKNLIYFIITILVATIAFQSYLLYKKDNQAKNDLNITKEIIKKDEPKITINIDKTPLVVEKKEEKSNPHEEVNNLTSKQKELNDSIPSLNPEQIEKDITKIFTDIFGSKEMKEGLKQFKEQAQEGIKQLQEGLQKLPQEFDKLSEELKKDPFFSQLIEGLKHTRELKLEDLGDSYYLKTEVPGGKSSTIDIKTKNSILTIVIMQKEDNNLTLEDRRSQEIVLLPEDAFIDHLKTNYENGILEITIPKIKNKTQL
jgi:HSP20 family molecular chaperone IbpA